MAISEDQANYGSGVAFVYIFNLIVGTGALAMPAGFSEAGWLASPIIVSLICLTSFISLTWIIESLSIANFIHKSSTCLFKSTAIANADDEYDDRRSLSSSNSLNIERTPLINCNDISQQSVREDDQLFDITERLELGHMARLFLKKSHLKLFYICVIIYLFGDLTIYSSAISKSLKDVTCTYDNCTKLELDSDDLCWPEMRITRGEVYRLYIVIIGLMGLCFNFHTKFLQFLTTLFRWFAFLSMIILASYALINNMGEGKPPKSNLSKVPNLFGICIYSFMCHHSLPRLITPIKNKKNLFRLLFLDYALVLGFYLFLSLTGIFTFKVVEDVYTLNFQKARCSNYTNATLISDPVVPQFEILELFLPLFPVFVLSTNFPIIAVTLQNNIRSLLLNEKLTSSGSNISRESWPTKIFLIIIVFIPPVLIAISSENVESLVSFTGSYGGTGIQYVIPLLLVYNARKSLKKIENDQEQLLLRSDESNLDPDNLSSSTVPIRNLNKSLFSKNFESYFKSNSMYIFISLWAIFCLFIVTFNHFVVWFDLNL